MGVFCSDKTGFVRPGHIYHLVSVTGPIVGGDDDTYSRLSPVECLAWPVTAFTMWLVVSGHSLAQCQTD